jgi:hypothetical protein
MNPILLHLILFVFAPTKSPAGDGPLLAKYMNASSKKLGKDTISFNVNHFYYAKNQKAVKQKYSGCFKRAGFNYYSQMIGITTIQNKYQLLTLDTAEKNIYVANPQKSGLMQKQLLKDIDLNQFQVKIFTDANADKAFYILPLNDRVNIKFVMKFNKDSLITFYRMESFEKHPKSKSEKDDSALEITFSDFNMHPPISNESFFNTAKFIYQKNNKIYPSLRYRNYTITDLRTKN